MNLKIGLSALAFAGSLAFAGQAAAATTVTSTFDTGTDGWTFGSYLGFSGIPVTYDSVADTITMEHGFGGFGFVAPSEYLGGKSDYVGGLLSFDLASTATEYAHAPLVALTGNNGKVIFSRWGATPTPSLQTFSVALNAGAFYTGSPTSMSGAVSAEAFQAIMADLEQVQIFGDWGPGRDRVTLDNVALADAAAAVPEPATWAMMILGFGAAGTMMRRRRLVVA
ncbi:laminin B domain-containing protein [Phenylobacterium sp.]|uniref:laminin B domain-containing protein n=1 Tax=Phenylobacterium sp. TaxID=1871053 RepID=UPI0025F9CA9D|nr:laminin B domain-containing protein [Phenylobacterium sp.]